VDVVVLVVVDLVVLDGLVRQPDVLNRLELLGDGLANEPRAIATTTRTLMRRLRR